MMSSGLKWWMVSLGAVVCFWTHGASAESCEQNADCPKGFTCKAYQTGACAGARPCAPGQMCPPPPPCEVMTSYACEPAGCNTDADCADFMVCHESTISTCSGGAAVPAVDCPPNTMCVKPEPAPAPSCSDEKVKQCTPRYQLACAQDADCGAGFSCVASQECSCSASAGKAESAPVPVPSTDAGTASGSGSDSAGFAPPVAAMDGGVDLPAPPSDGGIPSCECHPSAVKHCEPKQIECQSDADCPSQFACITYAAGGGSAGCAAPRGDAAVCEPVVMETFEEKKRCEPKYGYAGVRGGSGSVGAPEAPQSSMGGQPVSSNDGKTPAPVPTVDVGHAHDAGTEASGDDGDESATSDAAPSCSVGLPGAHGNRATAGYALGLALLVIGLRRRRQR